jgi:hypothetical protein
MISRSDCISEHILNGNMSPQGNLCYHGGSLEEERGNKDTSEEKADKWTISVKKGIHLSVHKKNHIN